MTRWILTVVAFLLIGCNVPQPGHRECWSKTPQGCYECVLGYCGWCENGCYSLSEGEICTAPVAFAPYCPDSPWPSSVLNPVPYRGFSRDGGADAGDAK